MYTLIFHESWFIFFIFVQEKFEIDGGIKILNSSYCHICIDALARNSAVILTLCDIIPVTIKTNGETDTIILKEISLQYSIILNKVMKK